MKKYFFNRVSAIFTFLYYSESIKNFHNFTVAQILTKELLLKRCALQKTTSNLVKVKLIFYLV